MRYPMIDAKKTGARIKALRKARNLSVAEIAHYMGFDTGQAVYKWQRGECLPTVDNLYALSRLFGTTMDEIIEERKEKDEDPSFFVAFLNLEFIAFAGFCE